MRGVSDGGDGNFSGTTPSVALYLDDRHEYFNRWIIPTIPDGNDIPLDRNINARENLYFATNQEREASEFAVFGEVTFAVTDQLSATLGARWFEEVRVSESYFQAAWSWTDDSWNDLFVNGRARQDSYGLLDLSGGVAFGDTNLSVYVNNATDENAELTRFSRGGDERIVANRPRSVGLSLSRRF